MKKEESKKGLQGFKEPYNEAEEQAAETPATEVAPEVTVAPHPPTVTAAPTAGTFPQVEVGSWDEAKMLLVKKYRMSKDIRDYADSLQRHARSLDFEFVIKKQKK